MATEPQDPLDIEIGRRARVLRLEKETSEGRSNGRLDQALQQVRKVETGGKRVDAVRLQQIAQVLEASLQSLYGDVASVSGTGEKNQLELIDTGSTLRLLRAYARIRSPALQRALTDLAEAMAATS
jgi:transcriptional regulator with XRE-family HTH domain